MFNGIRIILIAHLTLRGIWAGFVGLSYVFPEGVNRDNLSNADQQINYKKPEEYVIILEKMCSLLFSFAFSSVVLVVGLLVAYLPIILLFLTGLNITIIVYATLVFWLGIFALCLVVIIHDIKSPGKGLGLFSSKFDSQFLNITMAIYLSNLGKVKTLSLFFLYFLLIFAISYSDISSFDFDSDAADSLKTEIPYLNIDKYQERRNNERRIPRAAIDNFKVTDDKFELFVSYYKEDEIAVAGIKQMGSYNAKMNNVTDILAVYIDDSLLTELNWMLTQNPNTGQKGLITEIAIDSLTAGMHDLRIDKQAWRVLRKKIRPVEKWDVIPFEKIVNSP